MPSKHLIVIGASSGGIEALRSLFSALPADFAAPICLVLHISPQSPGILAEILNRRSLVRVVTARNQMRLEGNRIYVAPPDCHLVVEPGRLRVTKGPRENRFRPAIDPLFRSAAQVFGPAAIGVILTGNLDDGTAGLWAIKKLGGVAIVQDPEDAMFPAMAISALRHVDVDHTVRLDEIAPLLTALTSRPVHETAQATVPPHLPVDIAIAKEENAMDAGIEGIADPSPYACPECHGVLLQLKEEGRMRFRCHTGHAYSQESLLAAIGEGIEGALWMAVRSLEEGALLMGHLATHARDRDHAEDAASLGERANEAHRQAEAIRELLTPREPLPANNS